jgi:hypothetical protein
MPGVCNCTHRRTQCGGFCGDCGGFVVAASGAGPDANGWKAKALAEGWVPAPTAGDFYDAMNHKIAAPRLDETARGTIEAFERRAEALVARLRARACDAAQKAPEAPHTPSDLQRIAATAISEIVLPTKVGAILIVADTDGYFAMATCRVEPSGAIAFLKKVTESESVQETLDDWSTAPSSTKH